MTENQKPKTKNKKSKRSLFGLWSLVFGLIVSACNKSPFDRTRDASGGGALNQFGVASSLVVFNNELKTGGGAFEYPGGNNQILSFNDTSNPVSRRSIRYMWNGQPVGGDPSNPPTFAGFDLAVSIGASDYPSVPARDLSKAGYTQVTFYARGSLSSNTDLKIEVADDGNVNTPDPCITLSTNGTDDHCSDVVLDPLAMMPKTLTSSWQQYTITVPNSALKSVKDFFKATFVFTPVVGFTSPGQGGVAYFDVIQYAP